MAFAEMRMRRHRRLPWATQCLCAERRPCPATPAPACARNSPGSCGSTACWPAEPACVITASGRVLAEHMLLLKIKVGATSGLVRCADVNRHHTACCCLFTFPSQRAGIAALPYPLS